MSDDQKPSAPTPEQIKEAMAKAAANPGVMGQATMMMNMAYAFQFARMAKPLSEIVPLGEVNQHLARLHETKAVIISVSTFTNPNTKKLDVLISFYRLEG